MATFVKINLNLQIIAMPAIWNFTMPDKPNSNENFESKSSTLSKKVHLNLLNHVFGALHNTASSDKVISALGDKSADKDQQHLPAVKYLGVLAGFPYIGVVNLHQSQDVITSKIDSFFASIPDNKYNCHLYVKQFLDQNTKNLPHTFFDIHQFPSNDYLALHNYYPLKPVNSLSGVKLQQGDIVCVKDDKALVNFTHSGIVIGFENNNTPIIRQKLNHELPVVDLTPQGFDLYELKENNNNIPIPSTKHVIIYRHIKPIKK